MNQQLLLNPAISNVKTIDLEGIKAQFIEIVDGVYDVILEINSQKFLIKLENYWCDIENFEIIATKWFITDLTSSLVFVLKSLVEHLQFSLI